MDTGYARVSSIRCCCRRLCGKRHLVESTPGPCPWSSSPTSSVHRAVNANSSSSLCCTRPSLSAPGACQLLACTSTGTSLCPRSLASSRGEDIPSAVKRGHELGVFEMPFLPRGGTSAAGKSRLPSSPALFGGGRVVVAGIFLSECAGSRVDVHTE